MQYKYLFGPVPSRRLGMSLGIDVIPFKTCTLDCVYCECGPTTDLTIERGQYVPPQDVIEELNDYLSKFPDIDYITFSGSGEPTLYKGIKEIVDFLKEYYPSYKIALLTNGTLLYDKEVRDEIQDVDLILPSFDAGSMASFRAINRPHEDITLEKLKEGLHALQKEFKGKIWLEVFIVPGINDSKEELDLLRDVISSLEIKFVYVNTLDRPPAESWVRPISNEKLKELAAHIAHKAAISCVRLEEVEPVRLDPDMYERIKSLLRIRPRTASELASTMRFDIREMTMYLDHLIEKGEICSEIRGKGLLFKVNVHEENSND